MEQDFAITVMSTTAFDRLIAEVRFPDKEIGLIVSQEQADGPISVSIFSFEKGSRDAFEDGDFIPEITIDVTLLMAGVEAAKKRLFLLDVPREQS